MSYFISWTYGPGYSEIFLDFLSLIAITDLLALLILLWMCWRTRRKKDSQIIVSEGYENVTATSEVDKHGEVITETLKAESTIETNHAPNPRPPSPPTAESGTQTKVKEVKDQETATPAEPVKISAAVQTNPVENLGGGENQVLDKGKTDDDADSKALVRPPFERRKSRENIYFMSGWRRRVKLTELMSARLILETRVEELEREEITEAEVEQELAPFLIGRYPIAGLMITESGQKMSLYEGNQKGIITRGTAVSLLEAQAAVGSIINPSDGSKMSVNEAKETGLIDSKMASVLIRAERAVTGYKTRSTTETLSLFQAMKRKLVVESHGIRLLEAQIATGGIIDPQANVRLPVEVAFERGLFDERLHRILEDPSDDTKGFLDPNSAENLTYLELIQRCIQDEDTGLLLLPIIKDEERREYIDKYANTSYTSSRSPTLSLRTFSSGSESMGHVEDAADQKF